MTSASLALRDTRARYAGLLVVALTLSVSIATSGAGAVDDDKADAQRLIKELDLHPGMTAAEIGAGDGALSIAIAHALEPGGRLFASELGADHLDKLRRAIGRAGVGNVTIVGAAAAETRLPEACCDAVFMRDVYHHFGDPAAMNGSLMQSLKPCGRLAILDFTPPSGAESATPGGRSKDGAHGVSPRAATAELSRAGFEILQDGAASGRNFLILARRPASQGQGAAACPAPPV